MTSGHDPPPRGLLDRGQVSCEGFLTAPSRLRWSRITGFALPLSWGVGGRGVSGGQGGQFCWAPQSWPGWRAGCGRRWTASWLLLFFLSFMGRGVSLFGKRQNFRQNFRHTFTCTYKSKTQSQIHIIFGWSLFWIAPVIFFLS